MGMADFWNIVYYIFNIVFIIAVILLCKWLSSAKTFFDEKAKNLATKQDIKAITRKTEEVKSEFFLLNESHLADMRFKYEFQEKQYRELYVPLYNYVCQSESKRAIMQLLGEGSLKFEQVPIIEYESTNALDQPYNSVLNEILVLISVNRAYASPELLKIHSLFDALQVRKSTTIPNNSISDIEIKLKNHLIKSIVKDFNQLREALKLPYVSDEYLLLESDRFILEMTQQGN